MAAYLWNNSWVFNPRLGSCPDLLLRTVAAPSNSREAGAQAFQSYYFGPPSTGSLTGAAVVGITQSANLTTVGTLNTAQHFWNNSWVFNPRLGSCPDWLLRQIIAPTNINEIGGKAFLAYYTGLQVASIVGVSTILLTESGTLAGSGTLLATGSIALTESGLLNGVGALIGANSVAITEAGLLIGLGALSGGLTIMFPASGTPSGGLSPIVGSTAILVTESGLVLGEGALVGSTPIALIPSGIASAIAQIIGESGILFGSSAVLLRQGAILVYAKAPAAPPTPIYVVVGEADSTATEGLPIPPDPVYTEVGKVEVITTNSGRTVVPA